MQLGIIGIDLAVDEVTGKNAETARNMSFPVGVRTKARQWSSRRQ